MIALHDYQTAAVAAARTEIARGHRAVVIVAPTGAGKTVIASAIASGAVARGRRVLFLAHRTELIDQSYVKLRAIGLEVGTVAAASSYAPNPYHPAQVASIQTLLARDLRPEADVVLYDECHHAVAEKYASVVAHYSHAVIVGLTATPERSDGHGLAPMFSSLVVAARPQQLVAMWHDDQTRGLVPCEVIRPDRLLPPKRIAQSPCDAYLAHARGRKTIVFAQWVKTAHEHRAEFAAAGVTCEVVHGDMPWRDRLSVLQRFRDGAIGVVVNVFCLTEGLDIPDVSCVILARGAGTPGVYIQMAGRGLRPAPGKTDCMLIDLRGISYVHGHPLDDRTFSLDGKGIRGAGAVEDAPCCRVCGAVLEDGVCPDCDTGAREPESPKVTGDKLVKYAAKRAEGEDRRAETLARWIAHARAKGHREGSAWWKYAAVYGARPTPAIVTRARGILRESSL